MHGGALFRGGEGGGLLQEFGPREIASIGPGRSFFPNLLVPLPALKLGSRHLGGQRGGGDVAVLPRQHRRVRRQGRGGALTTALRRGLRRGRVVPQRHLPAAAAAHRQILHPGKLPQRRRLRRFQQRQQDPLSHALGLCHCLGRHRVVGDGAQVPHQLLGIALAVHHNQLFLRPGHGHVENPHLLGLGLLFQQGRHGGFGNGVVADAPLLIDPHRAQPQPGMYQHHFLQIVSVKGLVQIAEDHDGKLKALGLVDGHDAHAAPAAGGQLGQLILLHHLPDVGDEVEQPPPPGGRHLTGEAVKGDEILPPPSPAGHGAEHRLGVAHVVKLPQHLVGGQLPGRHPQPLQQGQKGAAVLPVVGAEGLVKVALPPPCANRRQPVRGEAPQCRAHGRQQRHVLVGIVDDLQKAERHRHLRRVKQRAALLAAAQDVPLRQCGGKGGHPGLGGAHEDDDVLLPAGAESAVVLHRVALVQQGADAARHKGGLLRRPVPLVLALVLHADQMVFRLRPGAGQIVFRAVVEPFIVAVVQLSRLPGENAGEHEVHRLQHLPPGPEVPGQQHFPRLPLPGGGSVGKGVVFPQENGGVGHAEAVDALLHVAHHKEVLPLPGHGGKNVVLHVVAVLVLVHHDLPVPPRHVAGQLRRVVVFLQQQRNGKVLHVGEIHDVPPRLLLPVGPGKVPGEVHQGQHSRRHGLNIVNVLLLTDGEDVRHLLQLVLAPVADGLGPLALRAGRHSLQPLEGGHGVGHGVPAPLRRLRHGPDGPGLLQKLLAVGVQHLRGSRHSLHGPFHLPGPVVRRRQHVRQHHPAVHAARQVGDGLLPAPAHLLKPGLRPGMALDFGVELRHQVPQLSVVPTLAQGVHQLFLFPVHGLVEPLQRVLQHMVLQYGGLLLVQGPEIRRVAAPTDGRQKVYVLPQQRRAKGVHRLDVRPVHPVELAPQMLVVRECRHLLGQLCSDLAPQLGSGGLGVGDDEEVVHVAALPDGPQQPLHQHLGLAAARRGGHQKLPAPVFHSGFLLFSQRYGHALPPPSRPSSAKSPSHPFSVNTGGGHTARRSSTPSDRGSRYRRPSPRRRHRGRR